ncbi:MAG: MGMT family protein [Demequina sp.]|nr:MGMT family protein [Demequina sp.]
MGGRARNPERRDRNVRRDRARGGRPRAARAVGTACARNLTTPFTPCHRVVSANGIGGFGGATELKRRMIELEQR